MLRIIPVKDEFVNAVNVTIVQITTEKIAPLYCALLVTADSMDPHANNIISTPSNAKEFEPVPPVNPSTP